MHRHPASTLLATAIAATTLVAVPAVAQAPRPTLEFDRDCYGEGEPMTFTGGQYTPGGDVTLLFARNGRIGDVPAVAGPDGAISGRVWAPEVQLFLADDEERGELAVTANDQKRMQDGTADADPAATFALATPTLTRTWAALEPKAPRPGRRFRVRVRGMAAAAGRPLYLHYRRGTRTLKVTSLGRLQGPCGDLVTRTRAFPMRTVADGRYTLLVSPLRRSPTSGPYFKFTVRVG